jgi:uncharacterized protein (TIGR03083 family)
VDNYLAQLRADGLRIAARARQPGALAAEVPDCPGWVLADLVGHLGRIYRLVLVALETGAAPGKGTFEVAPGGGVDPVDWFDAGHRALLARLSGFDPSTPTWTWWPADRSVGFWARRMCHETLVHRLDADGALTFQAGVTPELALDGVDEALRCFVARPERSSTRPAAGSTARVDVESGGRHWLIVVTADGVTVTPSADGNADARVSGDPVDVLRWSWGRRPYGHLDEAGQVSALRVVRAVIAEASG